MRGNWHLADAWGRCVPCGGDEEVAIWARVEVGSLTATWGVQGIAVVAPAHEERLGFLGKVALCGQSRAVRTANRLEIPGETLRDEKKFVERIVPCAMRSQNDKRQNG